MSQLYYSSEPHYTDLLNSNLVVGKPVTSALLKALHHNALYAAVRCEAFNMGFYTHGDTVPTPVSLVDGRPYSYNETVFIPILNSSRQPAPTEFVAVLPSPSGLIRDASGLVTVYLTAPMADLTLGGPISVLNTVSVGGTNFNGHFVVTGITSSTQFEYFQPGLPADQGGAVTATWTSSTAEVPGNMIVDSNGFVQLCVAGGTTGGSAPTWQTGTFKITSDGSVRWENVYGSGVWSGFTPGQQLRPPSANADVGGGDLVVVPKHLYVDPSSGELTATIGFSGSGETGQCTVRVVAFGQRDLGSLTFADGIPSFNDGLGGVSLETLLLGGKAPGMSVMRALKNNAQFSAVRMEVFDSGYFGNGDTVPLPTSSVDSYAYARGECLYVPVLASSRQPAGGYTPGQSTFPTLASSDLGVGRLLAAPAALKVDGSSGKVTTQMLFYGGAGLYSQGTVRVVTIAQRQAAQAQA